MHKYKTPYSKMFSTEGEKISQESKSSWMFPVFPYFSTNSLTILHLDFKSASFWRKCIRPELFFLTSYNSILHIFQLWLFSVFPYYMFLYLTIAFRYILRRKLKRKRLCTNMHFGFVCQFLVLHESYTIIAQNCQIPF
jgi:hypothetical protein